MLVVIGVESHDGGPGRARMRRIPNASADVLTDFVLDNLARGRLRTDAWNGYNDIGRYRELVPPVVDVHTGDDPECDVT